MPIILDGTLGITFPDNSFQSTAGGGTGTGFSSESVKAWGFTSGNVLLASGNVSSWNAGNSTYTYAEPLTISTPSVVVNVLQRGGSYAVDVSATGFRIEAWSSGGNAASTASNSFITCGPNSAGYGNNGSIGSGLGFDQQWQLVSRSANVNYQNTTGKPIMVSVQTTGSFARVYVGALTTAMQSVGFNNAPGSGQFEQDNVSVIVPVNHYYQMQGAFSQVYELR